MGLLEHKYHGGGLWLGSTFGTVLAHILASGLHGTGNPVIPYEIDSDVASLPVSGWLPYATKRNNLYQLIFAYGVNIVKNPYTGNPVFTFVYTSTNSAQELPDDEIFYCGDIEYTKPYSAVDVVEHTYAAITTDAASGDPIEPEVIFDNTTGTQVFGEEIWFDSAPMIVASLTTEGSLSLISATENSAIISGNGVLKGIPYTHTTRIVTKPNPYGASGQVVNVSECTMVNVINSQNLVNRLYAFYCPSQYIKHIKNSLKYTDQRCGKTYKFKNPYGEINTAVLTSIEAQSTSFLRANCEFYADYIPAGQQGLLPHVDPIVPDPDDPDPEPEGEWTVPEGVTEFKVVLIGGGTGGGSGWPGKNGGDAETYTDIEQTADMSAIWFGAEGGDGGAGGSGGSPGRVKVFTIQNAVPGTTYYWKLGQGGEGGAATGFIKDTVSELRRALENENPDTTYTDAQIETMIAQESSTWSGSPNAGSAGTATTFSDGTNTWSSADNDAYVPTGGFYDPIDNKYYAFPGDTGIKGGKGGARKVEQGGTFVWVTDGEDVTDLDGTVYHGGSTGEALRVVQGLPEAKILAYGGNGAGAAVGIDRSWATPINGGSDQETDWDVTEDS